MMSGCSGLIQSRCGSSPPGAPLMAVQVRPPSSERYSQVPAAKRTSGFCGWTFRSTPSRRSLLTCTQFSPPSSERNTPAVDRPPTRVYRRRGLPGAMAKKCLPPAVGRRQPLREPPPRAAAVQRLVEPRVRPPEAGVLPRALAVLPQSRVHVARVGGIDLDLRGAGVVVDVEHLLPCPAAVDGTEHTSLRVRPVRMAHARHEHDVGVRRMDNQAAHLLDVGEPDVAPGLAAVG